MNAKWPLLLKVQLMGLTGINAAKKSGDPRAAKKAAGGIAAFAVIGAVLVFYMVFIGIAFCEQGLGAHLPAFMIAIASAITFVFTLFQGCSMLFATKDHDMVMSLPVRKWEIIFSRLLCSYLVNLLFTLAAALPISAVYFIYEGFSFGALGAIALSALAAPLLPLAVAAGLSALVTALTAGFRFKNLLQTVFALALFVLLMVASFSFSFSSGAEGGADMSALFGFLVAKIYPPALLVDMTVAGGAAWAVFAYAGISLAVAAVFVAVVSVFYTKINTALLNHGARVAYKAKDIKSSSAFGALIKREFKRLFSSSGYLLNGACGVLLLVIFAIALLFIDLESVLGISAEDFGEAKDLFAYMGAGVMIVFVGMSCPSASALSLEGKSRGLLFSMPVSARQIMLAKSTPTFVLDCAAGLIFGVIFCLKLQAGAFAWVITLSTAVVFPLFIALFGSFLNYKFPKYEWTTETQVAKNSIPMLICVFGSMIFGIAAVLFTVFLGPWLVLAVEAVSLAAAIALFVYFGKIKLYV